MDICIRLEQPADYREVEEMVREAFWNQYAPGCMEHYLLHVMRGSPAFVPELDLVAVADGRVVGLVACMKGCIVGDDGLRHEVLTLGPIAVRPACQRQGVGRRLIDRVRATAASRGYRAVLLCGDPLYYLRVGFVAAERHGIRTADNVYLAALHVCPLHEGALRGLAGRYIEDEVYSVDEAEAEAFDRQFPPKERLAGTPSQLRFAEVCAMGGTMAQAPRATSPQQRQVPQHLLEARGSAGHGLGNGQADQFFYIKYADAFIPRPLLPTPPAGLPR